MKIGLLGCGNIAEIIIRAVEEGKIQGCEIICAYDIDKNRCAEITEKSGGRIKTLEHPEDLLTQGLDLVVEAASQKAVKEHLLNLLNGKTNVMVMSIGALLDEEFLDKIEVVCKKHSVKVYAPSGAIAGLDGLSAAAIGGISEVQLTSTKPIQSLKDNPYLEAHDIDLKNLDSVTIVFEGKATDAVKAFPKSINVCAALSLVGIGSEKTHVTVRADPKANQIKHEIKINGYFGELECKLTNNPSPNNPKTSYLAALSAIAKLKKISGETLSIGT